MTSTGQRELIRKLRSHTTILDIWDTARDGSLIIARQAIPNPYACHDLFLIDLVTDLRRDHDFRTLRLEFDTEVLCTLHRGQIISITKELSQYCGGLAVHDDPDARLAQRAHVHGWPGNVLRVEVWIPQPHILAPLSWCAPASPTDGT